MVAHKQTGIRLLIITPTLECGGSEKFVSLVCEYINTHIFYVCLVVVNNTNPFYKIANRAVEIIDLNQNRVLFALSAIKKVVNNCTPDRIYSISH